MATEGTSAGTAGAMPPAAAFSPLMEDVIERENLPVVTAEELDTFCAGRGVVALLFMGDHERLVESDDLAVIAPELAKAFDGAFSLAVVARESERPLQQRFRFTAYPAMVFLRDGGYLGAIERLLDWESYLARIGEILRAEPHEPPPFRLPGGKGSEQRPATEAPSAARRKPATRITFSTTGASGASSANGTTEGGGHG